MPIDDHDLGPFPDPTPPGDSDTNAALTQIVSRVQAWTGTVWQRLRTGAQTAANSLSVVLATDQVPLSTIGSIPVNGAYTGEQVRLGQTIVAGGTFAYGVDPTKWSVVSAGNGSSGFDPTFGEAFLRTTGVAGDLKMMISCYPVMYSGYGSVGRFAFRTTTPTQSGKLIEWGGTFGVGAAAATADAVGFYLQNGVWGIFVRKFGVTIQVPQSAWSIDKLDGTGPSGLVVTPADLSNSTIYGITSEYQSLFSVGNVRVHLFDLGNPHTSPVPTTAMNPPTIRNFYRVEDITNNGVTTDVRFHVAFAEVLTGTQLVTNRKDFSASVRTSNINSGVTAPVLTLQPATTISGVSNAKRVIPNRIVITYQNDATLKLYLGIASELNLSGASFAVPPEEPMSISEVDTSATAFSPTGNAHRFMAIPMSAGIPLTVDLRDVFTVADECLTIRGDGQQSMLLIAVDNLGAGPGAVVSGAVFWSEQV